MFQMLISAAFSNGTVVCYISALLQVHIVEWWAARKVALYCILRDLIRMLIIIYTVQPEIIIIIIIIIIALQTGIGVIIITK